MSTARKSPKSMQRAADLAKERDTSLVAVFALEEDVIENVVGKLSSEGWIGERPSQEFYDSAVGQRRDVGERKLALAREYADAAGVRFESHLMPGSFERVVKDAVAEFRPQAVVLTRRKRSGISRFFLGSPAAKLATELDCETVLVDEE